LNVQLNVEGISLDTVLSKMKYNRRREIKISYKEGAEVRYAANYDEVKAVYEILRKLYDTRVKLPLPTLDYFLKLSENPIGKVFVVVHNNNIMGGTFCTFLDKTSINTLYYAGLRSYHKKIFPTHLAIMGVIEFSIENSLKIVDFMGAGKPGEEYGVRDFKLQFGGDLVEHGRFIRVFNPIMFNLGKLGLKILSKIG
jgi:lipid II:glycine glycyltransferase (peptidoglycan interpeptide bridge formation enzyme)